jgi:oligopeptide transport system substrate-binding protein
VEELRITTAPQGFTRTGQCPAIPGWCTLGRSPDGRTYTFFLRTNAQWSTGEPITADDVLYSWFRVLDQATASDYAGTLFYVKNAEAFYNGTLTNRDEVGIHKRNAHTVEVELINPTAYWLDLCALPVLAVVPRQAIERYGDRWSRARPLPVSGRISWKRGA